jgi:hypothetical protein
MLYQRVHYILNHRGSKILWAVILGFMLTILIPSSSEAIPAFARKYDLSCTSCHTKPPRLNAFGEAFHMAGFQVPQTEEAEIRKKRRIGRIYSETDFMNIFSVRTTGNIVESFNGSDSDETNLTLPQEVEIYLAGTFTKDVSYFFELEYEGKEIAGDSDGLFEETSRFGLGKEFFVMFNFNSVLGPLFINDENRSGENPHGIMKSPMVMGPMVMVGKIDPSTNFSYPTNRQFILNVPGRVNKDTGTIERFTLAPYAFASKFYGIKTGEGDSVEVTKEVLYNTSGDLGVDVHGMIGKVMVQAGFMQGLRSSATDVNQKKDPYLMGRVNLGQEKYLSGSFSGLIYWGNDTARVDMDLIDWIRYGLSGNVKYKLLDIYGAFIWDEIKDLPNETEAVFDDKAFGFTVEADYLASDRLLLSARYDQLDAGGFVTQKADGKVLTLQARYYVRDNSSLYLRNSYNIENVSSRAIQNFRNLITLGLDFDF